MPQSQDCNDGLTTSTLSEIRVKENMDRSDLNLITIMMVYDLSFSFD